MTDLNLTNTLLGRYEIVAEIGRGGMGMVYQAHQTDLDRVVALKVLPPALMYNQDYIKRFRQEARNAARLEHPHIVPIYDIGEASADTPASLTLHYIAMKYIAGSTLKDRLLQEKTLEMDQVVAILAQVSDALDYAHRHQILHRDIKPSNIMITGEGWVYLTDFGMARELGTSSDLTHSGMVVGTPEYMAPEQAQGVATIGPSADIYALGTVAYEMLTGEMPFNADTPMGILAARLLEEPRPPREFRGDLPPAVEQVILRALARDPEQRFGSAAEMVAALEQAATQAPAPSPFPPAVSPPVANTGKTIALPMQQQVQGPIPASASGEQAEGSSFVSLLRTPSGLATTILVLFVLIAGWFRISSTFSPPSPPPTLPPVAISPTLPPTSGSEAAFIEQGWSEMGEEDYEQSVQAFNQALALNPRSYEARTGLGWARRGAGDYAQSSDQFATSLALNDGQYDALYGQGLNYYDQHIYPEAATHLRRAIELRPDSAEALFALGRTLEELGRLDEAQTAYEETRSLDSGYREEVESALQRLRAR